jgi:hypothetical protein
MIFCGRHGFVTHLGVNIRHTVMQRGFIHDALRCIRKAPQADAQRFERLARFTKVELA